MSEPPARKTHAPPAEHKETKHFIKGTIFHNEVTDELERLGISCALRIGAVNRIVVRKVRLGSIAYYDGMAEGDVIQFIAQNSKEISFSIERGDKTYQLHMPVALDRRLQANAIKAFLQQKPSALPPTENEPERKPELVQSEQSSEAPPWSLPEVSLFDPKNDQILRLYDIELIVDVSDPLARKDDAGQWTRFQWCADQVRGLARRQSRQDNKMTITAFMKNHRCYDTIEGCSADQVGSVFSMIGTGPHVDLSNQIACRLDSNLAVEKLAGRPLLLVVLSDKLDRFLSSEESSSLRELLQSASQFRPCVISMLDLGSDGPIGIRPFADYKRVGDLAADTSIHVHSFSELKEKGLANILGEDAPPSDAFGTP
jgi:hypothetical protein